LSNPEKREIYDHQGIQGLKESGGGGGGNRNYTIVFETWIGPHQDLIFGGGFSSLPFVLRIVSPALREL